MKKFLLFLSALFVGVSFATAQTYEINSNTGTLANGNSTTKSSVWSSTELAGFKLEADFAEAMNVNSGLLQLYAYNSGSDVTYTINAPEGYLITEYAVKYKKGARSHTFKIYADNVAPQEPGSTTAEQTYAVTGLSNENVNFYLSGGAGNVFIKIMTISVTLQKVGEGGEEPGDDSAIMEQYAAIEKPSFGKAGNTTFVKAATLTGGIEADVEGIQAVVGQQCVTNAIEVAAGAEFNLNITYQLNWGDLAIYQIENGEATKEYGYYEGSWGTGDTGLVIKNIKQTGVEVEGVSTVIYPITISYNHNPGDIIVVRAITGDQGANNSAYEQGISEGGYVDFLFVVTEEVAEVWSSFYATFPAVIPEGIEAYIVTAVNSSYVTLTQIHDAIPASTGVILKGGSIEADIKNYYGGEITADVAANLLKGSNNNSYITEEAYVLSNVDGEYGFYKALMTDGAWLNNANKAYLPASKVPAGAAMSASLRFDFDGTTGVEKVEIRNEKEEIYDLTGRRVNKITKAGVYVVNGRKILVK